MIIKESALIELEKLVELLKEEGFTCADIEEKPFNFETTAIKNKSKNKIQFYFGKKGLKKVIQGNVLSREYSELNNLMSGNYGLIFPEESGVKFEEYIGTDETGKGDFFGPLVVAGVVYDAESKSLLSNLNVRDSKDLSEFQITSIAKEIREKIPDKISIVSIHPEKYNCLYQEFQNVNKLLDWAHSKVIENLLGKFNIQNVIIDQFSKKPIGISLKNKFSHIIFHSEPRAEKYIGVAAASILARDELNKWFKNRLKEGLNLPKGASVEVEDAAKVFIDNNRNFDLNKVAKTHFKTVKKIFEN